MRRVLMPLKPKKDRWEIVRYERDIHIKLNGSSVATVYPGRAINRGKTMWRDWGDYNTPHLGAESPFIVSGHEVALQVIEHLKERPQPPRPREPTQEAALQ